MRKQFYQTALGNCYGLKLPKCRMQFIKYCKNIVYYNFRHTFVPFTDTPLMSADLSYWIRRCWQNILRRPTP